MIVVDTSALAAILFGEADGHRFSDVLARDDVAIGAPTRLEFLMVATGRRGKEGLEEARSLLDLGRFDTIDWSLGLVDVAADAFQRYGKGQHRAALNFGDCMAYAVAKSLGAPLLFKGDDFSLTDITPAI